MIRRICRSIDNFHSAEKSRKVRARAGLGLALVLATALAARAQVSVTTQHNDNMRTGQNTNETILTPSNVNVTSFGKLFTYTVDGYVYAQPLYVPNVTMGTGTPQAGTTHNVVFVATQNDSVYALDADNNGGANASPLWQVSLLGSGEKAMPNSDVSSGDIVPKIGITGTPVIDLTSNTIYVVAKSTLSDSSFYLRVHALDITTGQEKFGAPKLLQASVPGNGNGSSGGTLTFDTLWENNRPGLLLQNGILYIGFAAHGDNGPWHGWILAYNAKTLAQTSAYCSSPNGAGSGIWMSGSGLAADLPNPSTQPYGRMFIATGNGTFDAVTPYTTQMDYGDSVVHLDLTNGVITVADDFTPDNQSSLNSSDLDLASGGTLLLPDQSSGGHTHLLVQMGKQGNLYLIDRDTMKGYSSSTNNVVQEMDGQTGGLWSMPTYWNNHIFLWGSGNYLKDLLLSGGRLPAGVSINSGFYSNFPGATPDVSSNGTSNGIVWAIQTDGYGSNSPSVLRAFNATNIATELYDSTQATQTNNSRTDTAGAAVKFAVPTVVNGKVYVGTQGQLNVYGLLGGVTQVATPMISPAGKSFTGSLTVTITDGTSGATIHYTTDGSMPSGSSATYPSGGITVSSTQTISAIATLTGSLNSAVAAQTYTLQTQVLAPIFSPAPSTYSAVTNVTITDPTSGSAIYYTTDSSMPVPGQGTTKPYSSALAISTTTVLNAIATASGLTNSPVTAGTYTISTAGGGTATIDFSNGFSTSASTMTFNGSTDLDDTRLQLSNGGTNEANSAWYDTPVNIQSFTTNFAFQLSNPAGDGMTFTIQNTGLNAVGPYGGGLGYGPDSPGGATNNGNAPIANSVAIKFDFYSNAGEGTDSTGLYQNGASPTVPAVDMTSSGVNLLSGDTMNVQLVYNGTTLTLTITDAVAGKSFTTSWNVNIPSIVGGNTAYVGFTAGTGGSSSSQKVETWTFTSTGTGTAQTAATPMFSIAGGTYLGTQTVTLSDSTAGATIYYATNGTPSTSSTKYTGAITVAATETLEAIAVASGFNNSAVASATYTIESQVAAPTFSPAPGSYAAAQSVTISSTAGATIYYSTKGTPTTSSTPYTGPISVAASETIQAIAVQSGFFNSNVSSGTYTIGTGGTGVISLGSGFAAGSMLMNGSAALNGTRLRITDGGTSEAASAWFNSPVNIQQFTTNFSFQITGGTSPTGDGLAFVIQNGPTTSIGALGGSLGYAGIANSVAVKFDLYSNAGEGTDSTGEYVNGAIPTVPSVDMTSSGVNLHSTDVFNVQITYDGTTLTMTITDATTSKTFSQAWTVNIPSTVGANSAYVGFTGGTGGNTAIQDIINWTMTSTPPVTPPPTLAINDASGFTSTGMTLNGSTALNGTRLRLTNAPSSAYEAGSAWNTAPVNIQAFTTDFTYQIATTATSPLGNGLTFTIQNAGTTALGPIGGGLGYGPSSPSGTAGIGESVAVKFDLINNAGEGTNSTGLFTNGASPTVPATTIGGGVALNSGDIFAVHMTYDGTTLTMTITDTTNTAKTFTTSWPVNIPSVVGGNTALVGFTAGTGYSQANQDIITWTFSNSGTTSAAATPTFSPAGGSYAGTQSVTIASTKGATIYYSTNGTTPSSTSPSSTLYSGAISVAASETVQAIALASGLSNSAVGSASYTIGGGPTIVINDGSGFTSTGMTLNGSTAVSGTRMRLTSASTSTFEAGTAWNTTPVNVQTFTTDFTFQIANTTTNPTGNGLAFVIQNAGATALGPIGGGLGYGPDSPSGAVGIGQSVAVKFDLINNAGEGTNSTGLYTNGASPTVPATTIGGGVALNNGDVFAVHITYDGTTLTMTITDTSNTAETFTTSWPVNIPTTVGGNTALVGFTAGTGYSTANQDIVTWTYSH